MHIDLVYLESHERLLQLRLLILLWSFCESEGCPHIHWQHCLQTAKDGFSDSFCSPKGLIRLAEVLVPTEIDWLPGWLIWHPLKTRNGTFKQCWKAFGKPDRRKDKQERDNCERERGCLLHFDVKLPRPETSMFVCFSCLLAQVREQGSKSRAASPWPKGALAVHCS